MSQERDFYGDNADALIDIPQPFQDVLRLIEQHRADDLGPTLHAFVASLVHPDCVCNLALLPTLPAGVKAAVIAAFSYCMEFPLTPTEQGKIARFLFPS